MPLTNPALAALIASTVTVTGPIGSFSNANGISFGANANTITASHNAITSQSNQQITAFATGNTTQSSTGTTNASSLIFRGQGVASVGITNGSIVIDAPAGAPSPVNFSAGTTSSNLGSVVFSNSNGVSFGLNGATITGSIATSLTNVNLSAGTTSNNLSAFVFSNSNNVSFGLDGSTVTATATVATSLTNVNLSAGTTSNNLSAFVFSDSNGVSFGLNGSTVTASVNAGGGDKTLSYYDNLLPGSTSTSQVGNATLRIFPLSPANEVLPGVITANTIQLNMTGTVSTGAAWTRSVSIGFYTVVNSTQLSLAFSASTSFGTNAGNMNINDSVAGWRWLTFHSSQFNNAPNFSATRYFCALWNRSSSGSQSFSNFGMASFGLSNARSGTMGTGSVNNTTLGWFPFNGIYSASFSTAMPNALAASDINKNVAEVAWIPQVVLNSLGTVV